jgi:uncharacterized protein (DUF362 family)
VTDLASSLDTLGALACSEGGWPYAPGQLPHVEPTCLALLALSAQREKHSAQIAAGEAWLRQCAVGDGTYRLARGRHEAAWPTALVLFTLAELGAKWEELETGARALLALRGRASEAADKEDVNDIDGSFIGWPWAERNFSWVEPTAWACLALTRLGHGDHPRVQEGRKLLLDRVLEGGGVNYGNRRIFGISLEPIPTPTSLALLALQGCDDERVGRSVEYLRQHALTGEDVEHLGWAVLALDATMEQRAGSVSDGVIPVTYASGSLARSDVIQALQQRLLCASAARVATPYVQPAPLRQALLALALDVERRNPFRLPGGSSGEASGKSAVPLACASGLYVPRKSLGDRVRGFIQGLAVTATTQLRQVDTPVPVHIAPASDYRGNLADVVRRQYETFRARVPLKGKRVVLKPNLVEYHRDKVINTHPHLIAAVIELCRREEASEVIVAEGPGHWRNVEYLVAESGLGDVLRHYKAPFVDLNHDEPVKRINLGRLTKLEHLYLSRTIASAEVVISLPKLKTHHWAVATLSLKNLFGTLPGICYGWPKNELHWRGIDNSIVDIALTRTPDLAIVDGIVGMEGDGPLNGTPKHSGVIVMGTDLVAVDATCCRLMKLDPEKIGYLVLGDRKKLGALTESQILQVGETIAARAQAFDTVEHFRPVWMGRSA